MFSPSIFPFFETTPEQQFQLVQLFSISFFVFVFVNVHVFVLFQASSDPSALNFLFIHIPSDITPSSKTDSDGIHVKQATNMLERNPQLFKTHLPIYFSTLPLSNPSPSIMGHQITFPNRGWLYCFVLRKFPIDRRAWMVKRGCCGSSLLQEPMLIWFCIQFEILRDPREFE